MNAATRILVRHIKPGDRVLIDDRPKTVVRVEERDQRVRVFTSGNWLVPYLYTDSDLISLLPSA
ncbi:hypothetical protein ACWELB_21000 [Streptomyces asiaticus]